MFTNDFSPEILKVDTPFSFDGFKIELPFYDSEKDEEGVLSINETLHFWTLKKWKSLQDKEKVSNWKVLFFYPADFTFVCPTELKDLADVKKDLDKLEVEVFPISTDSIYSHKAWVKQELLLKNFKFKMLSDHNLELSKRLGILDIKTWMADRATYIVDSNGILRSIEITSGPLGRNSEELIRKIEALQFIEKNKDMVCPARWKKGDKTIKPSLKISWNVFNELN